MVSRDREHADFDARRPPRAGAVAGGVGAATLVLFVVTTCPTVPFGDGGELIAAADCLGVAHPPGYPLYTTLGWLVLQLPWGEPALRMNLLSALFGALTCSAAAWFVQRAVGSVVGAVAAGLTLAVSSTFWAMATVTEVYTLHLLLMTVMLCAALAYGGAAGRRPGALLVGAAALGLGLAHHPTIVLALPAALLLALGGGTERSWPARLRGALAGLSPWIVLAAVALALALPVSLALSLKWRAGLDPPSNWGHLTSFGALWSHVSAAAYRHLDLGWSGLLRGASWATLGRLLVDESTPLVWPLALLGIGVRLPRGGRGTGVALSLLIAAGAVFGLRYATEDVQAFFLPLIAGLALAAGIGVGWLATHARVVLRRAAIVVAVLLVLLPAAQNFSRRNLQQFTAAREFGRDLLDTVPQRGVLFVEVDDAFVLLYLHQVLGERQDVTIFDRNGVLFNDVVEPSGLRPAVGESGRAFRIRVEQTFIDRELSRPDRREVTFIGWPGYDAPAQYRMEPVGLLYRVCRREDPAWDAAAIWAGYREASVRRQAQQTGDQFALGIAATYPLARGERALYDRRPDAAEAEFRRALELAPHISGIANYIGVLYGRSGDYPRAIASIRRALQIKPTSVRAWNNLAMAYERQGDLEAALEAWETSLRLIPAQGEARAAVERLRLQRRAPPSRKPGR